MFAQKSSANKTTPGIYAMITLVISVSCNAESCSSCLNCCTTVVVYVVQYCYTRWLFLRNTVAHRVDLPNMKNNLNMSFLSN
jgi:hypothetical protein